MDRVTQELNRAKRQVLKTAFTPKVHAAFDRLVKAQMEQDERYGIMADQLRDSVFDHDYDDTVPGVGLALTL